MDTQWALGFDALVIGIVGFIGMPRLAFFFLAMVGGMMAMGWI